MLPLEMASAPFALLNVTSAGMPLNVIVSMALGLLANCGAMMKFGMNAVEFSLTPSETALPANGSTGAWGGAVAETLTLMSPLVEAVDTFAPLPSVVVVVICNVKFASVAGAAIARPSNAPAESWAALNVMLPLLNVSAPSALLSIASDGIPAIVNESDASGSASAKAVEMPRATGCPATPLASCTVNNGASACGNKVTLMSWLLDAAGGLFASQGGECNVKPGSSDEVAAIASPSSTPASSCAELKLIWPLVNESRS